MHMREPLMFLSFLVHILMISIAHESGSKRKTMALYPLILINMIRSCVQCDDALKKNLSLQLFILFVESAYTMYIMKIMQKYANANFLNILIVLVLMMSTDAMHINSHTSLSVFYTLNGSSVGHQDTV